MVYIRSFIFNSAFYVGTAILVVVMGPVLLLPPFMARYIAQFWGWLAHKQLYIVGIRQREYGDRHLDKQVIYAVKHQSAWETIILSWLLHAPAFVLKVELLRLPIIGLFFIKTGCIPVDRADGMRAVRKIRDAALKLAAQGRSMLIFPLVRWSFVPDCSCEWKKQRTRRWPVTCPASCYWYLFQWHGCEKRNFQSPHEH